MSDDSDQEQQEIEQNPTNTDIPTIAIHDKSSVVKNTGKPDSIQEIDSQSSSTEIPNNRHLSTKKSTTAFSLSTDIPGVHKSKRMENVMRRSPREVQRVTNYSHSKPYLVYYKSYICIHI